VIVKVEKKVLGVPVLVEVKVDRWQETEPI
jgi:hypothetical protein